MILFIDDEKRYSTIYVEAIEDEGHVVEFQKDVDEAWGFFDANADDIDLIVLDIMMSPGSTFGDEDTEGGLRTGLFFYERVREKAPDLPVVILTNASDEELIDRFRGEVRCWFRQKKNYLPFEIAREVRRILALT